MSLKARIEAVIYAAEEPVTLPQLAAIFREEALASRAARLASTPQATSGGEPGSAVPAPESEHGPEDVVGHAPEPAAEDAPEEALVDFDASAVPSESAAQNSSDAEIATPDFEGQPQPFPNEPAEATTPGREDNPGLLPEMERPDHAEAPALNAPADSEVPAANVPENEPEGEPGAPLAASAALSPEEEKRQARQREREVREEIRRLIDELLAEYAASDRGVEIREIAGGFRMATRAEYHDAVRSFVRSLKPPMKLSLQALETLAVIAYKQPVTGPEIGEIRGVDSGGVLGSLVARKLVTTAGRKQVIGRPILYKTTKEFLLRFGLKDLNELPSMEEFEKMASELAEGEEEPAEQIPFAQNAMAGVEEDAGEEDSGDSEIRQAASDEIEAEAAAASKAFASDAPAGSVEPARQDEFLPPSEPEVGAAATEPAESRVENTLGTGEFVQDAAGDEPEAEQSATDETLAALAGAEVSAEMPSRPAEEFGPADGDPPPTAEDRAEPSLSSEEGKL